MDPRLRRDDDGAGSRFPRNCESIYSHKTNIKPQPSFPPKRDPSGCHPERSEGSPST